MPKPITRLFLISALLLRPSWQGGTAVLHPDAIWQCCPVWEKVRAIISWQQKHTFVTNMLLLSQFTMWTVWLDSSMFQNVPSVPRNSSGICCVQSALLSLLRSHGKRPVQRHYKEQRVRIFLLDENRLKTDCLYLSLSVSLVGVWWDWWMTSFWSAQTCMKHKNYSSMKHISFVNKVLYTKGLKWSS